MKQKLSAARVYSLKGWTVKVENGKYFVAPTYDQKGNWKGPYKSLQHATTAIARKLQAEFAERHNRLEKAS